MKSWLKEIARDLLALGSIPFYFLVIIRAVVGKYSFFVYEMVIAAAAMSILHFIIKKSSFHVARAFVAVIFTSFFYKQAVYTIFSSIILILVLISAYCVKKSVGHILRGIIIGILSSLVGYYGAVVFNNF